MRKWALLVPVMLMVKTGPAGVQPVEATVYTVTNTNDSGAGSLRQAITDANTNGGQDSIHFAVPGPGPHTIQPASELPVVSDPVAIDGYTQSGASPATPSSPATLMIELDGTNAGLTAYGLVVSSGWTTVRGLAINRFARSGIQLHTNGGNVVEGNHIGTDVSGTSALGNAGGGVFVHNVAGNTIGGMTSLARNVISGNSTSALLISSGGATGNVVQGNYIGTDAGGTSGVGNSGSGLAIEYAPGNTIGGMVPGARNVISDNGNNGIYIIDYQATGNVVLGNYIGTDVGGTPGMGNTGSGVAFLYAPGNTVGGVLPAMGNVISGSSSCGITVVGGSGTTGNAFLSNSIFANGGLGIDLDPSGVTANDVGDPDTGVNNLQNFPVLASAVASGANTIVEGSLNSTANDTFRVELFSNGTADPSSHGEGESFLAAATVVTDGSGDASFVVALPTSVPGGHCVSATATNLTTNDTSEFSRVVYVISLTGDIVAGQLVLDWTAVSGTANYWVHGVDNQSYFEPGLGNRLVVLGPGTTTWSSSSGVGDPEHNWTYVVLAVNASLQELGRSNRFGEYDLATAPGP